MPPTSFIKISMPGGQRISGRNESAVKSVIESLIKSLEEEERADRCRECLEAAKRVHILAAATPTQFGQIWDRTLKGEKFEDLVDELGRIQEELAALARAKERAA